MDRFEIDKTNSGNVNLVLFNCLRRDAPLTTEGNPKERVEKLFSRIDKDILELCSKFSCTREDIVREYLKSLFDRHQALDRQRKGKPLSRDDRVRLHYSPVKTAEVLTSNFTARTQNAKTVPNLTVVANDEKKDVVVELKKVGDDSEAMADPKEENSFEKLECEEVLAQEEEDATANVSPQFLDEKKEDDATQTTAAETAHDQSVCMSVSKCKDIFFY